MSKRKCTGRTLAEKLAVICEVDKNERPKSEIAQHFGIPLSTLSTYMKNRNAIEQEALQGGDVSKRKRIRGAKHEDLEDQLFEWFCHCKANNISVDGKTVKAKADEIAWMLGIESFKCSDGWMARFKQRKSISWGEYASENVMAADTWRESVKPIIEQYEPRDIYSLDETALFYNSQPKKTLTVKEESGRKDCKDRVTLMLCCNADGSDKLQPVVIGKFSKPRCTKGMKTCPCIYMASKNTLMTAELFREWLMSLEGMMTVQNRNILLIMHHCAAHNTEGLHLKHVRILFLPAFATSYMQPLDQGIISCLKRIYRQRFVSFLLREINRKIPAEEIRKWNVFDAMRGVAVAWKSVNATLIQNCFRKCGFDNSELHDKKRECDDWVNLKAHIDGIFDTFQEFVEIDDCELTTDDRQNFENRDDSTRDEENTTDDQHLPGRPSHEHALKALSVLDSVVASSDEGEEIVRALDLLQTFVTNLYKKKLKQTNISVFKKQSVSSVKLQV